MQSAVDSLKLEIQKDPALPKDCLPGSLKNLVRIMKVKLKIYLGVALVTVIMAFIIVINKTKKQEKFHTITKPREYSFSESPETKWTLKSKPKDYPPSAVREFPEAEDDPKLRSKIKLSPNYRYSAYISPLKWEVVGNLFIKDRETGEVKKLTHYQTNRSYTPKTVVWLNDTLLLVIEGYTWGTVTVGGSLYIVDSRTGKMHPILKPPIHQEVAEVSTHKNSIVLRIATHDKNRMSYRLSTKVLPIDSVLNSLTEKELLDSHEK